jgi:hypothetical protein
MVVGQQLNDDLLGFCGHKGQQLRDSSALFLLKVKLHVAGNSTQNEWSERIQICSETLTFGIA